MGQACAAHRCTNVMPASSSGWLYLRCLGADGWYFCSELCLSRWLASRQRRAERSAPSAQPFFQAVLDSKD